jgi:hypothetical protein
MRKIRLDPDSVRVDTFDAGAARAEGGTVHAHAATRAVSCDGSCAGTCLTNCDCTLWCTLSGCA